MAFKIDISKAFDRVDWNFLQLLKKMGFEDKCGDQMKLCLQTVHFLVSVNGDLVGPIYPERP